MAFRRRIHFQSCRRGNRHITRPYEFHSVGVAVTGAPKMVGRRRGQEISEFFPWPALTSSPGRRPGWRQASHRGASYRPPSLVEQPGSFKIESEPNLRQSFLAHGVSEFYLIRGIEHQESAATRADDLSAERTIRQGVIVPCVDLVVARAARALLLALPMQVHKPRELREVARLQRLLALLSQFFNKMEVFQHGWISLLTLIVLFFQDRRRRPRVSGEEEQQIVLEVKERFLGDL